MTERKHFFFSSPRVGQIELKNNDGRVYVRFHLHYHSCAIHQNLVIFTSSCMLFDVSLITLLSFEICLRQGGGVTSACI